MGRCTHSICPDKPSWPERESHELARPRNAYEAEERCTTLVQLLLLRRHLLLLWRVFLRLWRLFLGVWGHLTHLPCRSSRRFLGWVSLLGRVLFGVVILAEVRWRVWL